MAGAYIDSDFFQHFRHAVCVNKMQYRMTTAPPMALSRTFGRWSCELWDLESPEAATLDGR